ncbi:hypothetical protein TNCV_3071821 [Trichonephila clavipes]|nr:hypothetical protein TNCV_3071821 [Trichonephila clavipes]
MPKRKSYPECITKIIRRNGDSLLLDVVRHQSTGPGAPSGVTRDVLGHGPTEVRASILTNICQDRRSNDFSPKRYVISERYLFSEKICHLAICDDRRPCVGLGLPPYIIITLSNKRRQSVEQVLPITLTWRGLPWRNGKVPIAFISPQFAKFYDFF